MEVPAAPATDGNENKGLKTLISLYSNCLWNRVVGFVPSSDSNFLGKIPIYFRSRSRKRRACLPLPLPSNSLQYSPVTTEASRVCDVLHDILEHIFSNLHNIQKNMQFWQSRAEVYMEIDRFGEELLRDPENSLPSLLIRINGLFFKLEASVGHLHAMRQCDSSVEGSYSVPLLFEKLPEINQEGSQWTDCEIRDAINLVYQNLEKLDSYLSYIVAKHRKPRKVTQYWIRYTCGVVGLSVCSMWLIGHSRLMGSPDIDNWLHEARDSTISFFSDHVEQPLLSIRDELFETFRKRHRGMMDLEEVQLTSNSLHRMLLAFSEQTKGQKFPENAPDQEMLEIVMARDQSGMQAKVHRGIAKDFPFIEYVKEIWYEKELTHPITNLLNGELARAMLIQVQKLKLDIETAMLELNQILRANEINFAILAALPAFFLSLALIMLMRAWFKQDTRAEGRGRIARLQRRLLVVEVEKKIMQYRTFVDQGMAGGGDGGEVDECPQQKVVLMLMARPYYHDVTML
ncbi:hypothetical protein ACE6H2_015590 [Prunus campanulata]